jgi:hypothetical protein
MNDVIEEIADCIVKDRIDLLRENKNLREHNEKLRNQSDGYHTFDELYSFRKAYNVALFNEWAANEKHHVHKSWRHHDGDLCFGGGWFIVVAVLPSGQISNHYAAKDWDLFRIPVTDCALFEFDGHTSEDVISRLSSYVPDNWKSY